MSKKQLTYLLVFSVSLFLVLCLNVVVYFLAIRQGNDGVTLQLFGGGDDGAFYWEQIQNILRGLPWIRTSVYPLVSAFFIRLTNLNDVFMIRLFNLIAYFVLVIFSLKIVEHLYLETNKKSEEIYNRKIFLIVAFTIYLSLQMNVHISILRDVWIYALYVMSLYYYLKILNNKGIKYWNIVVLLISLYVLGQFRAYILVSFLMSSMLIFIYRYLNTSRHLIIFFGVVFAIFVLYYTFLMDFQVPFVEKSLRDGLIYRFSAIEFIDAGSQMNIDLITPNFVVFIVRYIHSFFGNLIGPLPWHISGFSTLIVFFAETTWMAVMVYYIFKNRRNIQYTEGVILIHGLVWNGFIAFSNDNIGTATRLRPITWILFIIVFINIISNRKKTRTLERR